MCKYSEFSQHITCESTGAFWPSCPTDRREVTLTNENIQNILDLHNKYRNKIAGGNEPGFNPAVRMATLKWNAELAGYASLNVRRCKARTHDCHNTPKFQYSGQNLFFHTSYGGGSQFEDISTLIESSINVWYDEKKYATQSDIDSCCGPNIKKDPHFFEMVLDRADQIGCAIAEFTDSTGKTSLFACNYSFNIITDQKVYESGLTASKCTTGTNPEYPALCSHSETIDPNKVF